ncbi:hypothetical protein RHODGE_RHODGE_02851 [Rhodoplanes serenus]|uniref:Uncharacterized protein n=2 Tax=Nitrobacteraceae TaxID=41294 RepID=A0A3S4B5I6_9BRAD|nr:hypothetical protein RHODGE_RHODGE_02851 [Rhodoplanes serenus]
MTSARYVEHVTMTTGDVRRTLRSEVADRDVAVCSALLRRVLSRTVSASTVPIPRRPGYSLGGRAAGGCMAATVWADGPPSVVIATIGIATRSLCGARLWRDLHRYGSGPVVTDPAWCPPEPWLAVALERGIVAHVDATDWLGDFERCLAWAFLELRS